MAFWKQKTTPTSVPTPAATPRKPVEVVASPSARVAHLRTGRSVLVRPHLTEKSSVLAERRQYTFLVTPDAEKISIARDVAAR
ncbi:50S ribosomal protein L23, partial [Candidatus Uhrbacteria bacterium]|nr:50S ribosomal protein L23 [Candidatus Uhrbacteria bacterium]